MKIDWKNRESVLAAVKRYPAIFYDEYRVGLMAMGDLLVASVVEKTPVGGGSSPTGHLSNSIQAGEPKPSRNGMAIQIGTPAEYAEVIEHGRTPGQQMPPVEDIAVWVWERKHLFGDDVKTEKDAMRIAYPIALSIARNGFKTAAEGEGQGWGMFGRAMKEDMAQLEAMGDEMKERIERRCTEAFNGV